MMINIENIINIVVCEDDENDALHIKKFIECASSYYGITYSLKLFSCAEMFLENIDTLGHVHLMITDIYMKEMTGITLLQTLREKGKEIPVAFVSSSRDFGIDAFQYNALHYIVKPITQEQINEIFRRLFDQHESPLQYLVFLTAKTEKRYPLKYIKHIHSHRKGVELYIEGYKNIEWLSASSIEIEKQLQGNDFIRLNRSDIVNLKYIDYIEYDICFMKDKTELQISRNERKKAKKMFEDYIFKTLDNKVLF